MREDGEVEGGGGGGQGKKKRERFVSWPEAHLLTSEQGIVVAWR